MSRRSAYPRADDASKDLFFRYFSRGAALASTCGVLVCAQAGCLIPQTVDPIVASPHVPPQIGPENIPPYLLPRVLTLFQQGASDVTSSPPCHCRLEFDQITVEEQDSTVTLLARWFVDYDPSNPPSTLVVASERIAANFNDVTQTTRPLTNEFRFDASTAGASSSGLHVVEVVIAEETGFDDTSTSLPNRAMKPGFASASYKFVVDLHLEQIPGTCPSTPPSHRVCQ
jgi:hypothetical protein